LMREPVMVIAAFSAGVEGLLASFAAIT